MNYIIFFLMQEQKIIPLPHATVEQNIIPLPHARTELNSSSPW